jgi:hypothetical protein
MKTTLSETQSRALEFVKSGAADWSTFCSERKYGNFSSNPAEWKKARLRHATFQSLQNAGLIKVVGGRYVAA